MRSTPGHTSKLKEMLERREEADFEASEEADEADLEATDDADDALLGATLDADERDELAVDALAPRKPWSISR